MSALGDAGAKAKADHLCAEEQTNNSFVVHIVCSSAATHVRTAAQICAYWRPSHYAHRLNVEFRLLLKHDSVLLRGGCLRICLVRVCLCVYVCDEQLQKEIHGRFIVHTASSSQQPSKQPHHRSEPQPRTDVVVSYASSSTSLSLCVAVHFNIYVELPHAHGTNNTVMCLRIECVGVCAHFHIFYANHFSVFYCVRRKRSRAVRLSLSLCVHILHI